MSLRGGTYPCCKYGHSLGNWRKVEGGVVGIWKSPPAIKLRERIIAGEYPDRSCEVCHKNGTSTTLSGLLKGPLNNFLVEMRGHTSRPLGRELTEILQLRELFERRDFDDASRAQLAKVRSTLAGLAAEPGQADAVRELVAKVGVIADVTEDFLNGEVQPRQVAPLRQPNLIAICNARCIQCPGNFSGTIENGVETVDGKQTFTEMDDADIDETFAASDSIIDFFTNGSEFLFLKRWRRVADYLKGLHVKIRLSTNGMLLTQKHTDYLIDHELVRKLNISLDGARPETIEAIRVRVKFDRVMRNLRYFVDYCERKKYSLPISFSFCLMRRNYAELAEYVDLIGEIIRDAQYVKPNIQVQGLSQRGVEDYEVFLGDEHHSLVAEEKLRESFQAMQLRSAALGIPVQVFYTHDLKDFVADGCPVPEMDFVPSVQASAVTVNLKRFYYGAKKLLDSRSP